MDIDLYDQWMTFCKAATPGTRYWLDDELYNRLWDRIGMDARCSQPDWGMQFCIEFRAGYRGAGQTFYPKSIYPNPPRQP
jgi:hypothetical protein